MTHYKGAAKEASRAMNLIKKRQKEQEELEMRKRKIEDELKIGTISNKFAAHYDAVETKLKSDTVGMYISHMNGRMCNLAVSYNLGVSSRKSAIS